jgi:hypothetical protein
MARPTLPVPPAAGALSPSRSNPSSKVAMALLMTPLMLFTILCIPSSLSPSLPLERRISTKSAAAASARAAA